MSQEQERLHVLSEQGGVDSLPVGKGVQDRQDEGGDGGGGREGEREKSLQSGSRPFLRQVRRRERTRDTLARYVSFSRWFCILERKKAGETEPDGKTGEVRGGRLSRRAFCLSVSPGMGYTLAPVRCLRPAIPGRRSVPVVAQLQSARVDIVLCGEKVCPVVP